MRLAIVIAGGILAGPISSASAQVSPNVRDELADIRLGERTPTIVWTAEPDDSFWVVSVYSQPFGPILAFEPQAERYWIALWNSGRGAQLSEHVLWADSRTCPALAGVLWELDQLHLPGPRIAGMTPDRPTEGTRPAYFRSPIYTIWGGAGLGDFVYRSGSDPLHGWGEAAQAALEPCWTDEPPEELLAEPR